jgi:Flp pilus assembly protein TadG
MPRRHSIFIAKRVLPSALRRIAKAEGGMAAIEFGILSAVMMIFVIGAADLGLAGYSAMEVQTSAQSGAEYASAHAFDATAISNAVTNSTSASGISASPAPAKFCGCPSASGVTTATCSSTCADGSTAGNYVRVTATRSYSTMISYPGMSNPLVQTTVTTVRTP